MKIVRKTELKCGTKDRVTIDVPKGSRAIIISPQKYYLLGGVLDQDVVDGGVILDSIECYWCSYEQKWLEK